MLSTHSLLVKLLHLLSNQAEMSFDGEMAGLQAVHLRLREVLEIGLAACWREEDVTLPPEDNGFRLMALQERLPFCIQLYIGTKPLGRTMVR